MCLVGWLVSVTGRWEEKNLPALLMVEKSLHPLILFVNSSAYLKQHLKKFKKKNYIDLIPIFNTMFPLFNVTVQFIHII